MTTTALVPFDMYANKSLLDLSEYGPYLLVDREMAAIKSTVKGICIEGALSILDVFGYRGTHIHYSNNRWVAEDLANERYFPECQGRMAHETPVFWFWGGPPNKLKWYQGMLQTLLEDRILCEIVERGTKEVAKWIGTDLTEVTQ
jgi:hypothetical protein